MNKKDQGAVDRAWRRYLKKVKHDPPTFRNAFEEGFRMGMGRERHQHYIRIYRRPIEAARIGYKLNDAQVSGVARHQQGETK